MKPIARQNADERGESIAELWGSFVVPEHAIPVMLDMPRSTYDTLKRVSAPRTFGIGKRNFVIVDDLKQWLKECRDTWEPRPQKGRAALRALAGR